MAVLQSTNIVGSLCVNGVAVGGGKDFNYRCFTSSISFTPTSDLVSGDGYVMSHIVGGGGGSGASYVAARAGLSPSNVVCASSHNTIAGLGAGGGYFQSQSFITSTDAIAVTVGAGGSAGAATGLLGSQSSCQVQFYSCSIAGSGSTLSAGGSGGTSVFNNITAYGGCGGNTCARVCKSCGKDVYCVCALNKSVTTTVTNAGLYGAFRYDPYNKTVEYGRACCSNVVCSFPHGSPLTSPTSESAADFIPTSYDVDNSGNNCNQGFSGMGIPGVDNCVHCGTYPNCNMSANVRPFDVSQQTAGNVFSIAPFDSPRSGFGAGGAGGCMFICSTNCSDPGGVTNNFCTTSSAGQAGTSGIVVIQWYE